MIAVLAAFLAAHQAAPSQGLAAPGGRAWIVATVGHSEWCPAGNVRLDLETGRYAFTPRAARRTCADPGLERPVEEGRMAEADLADVRSAFARAVAEGVESRACREHRRPEQVIVSNGGRHVLVLTTGDETVSAPDDLSCWSGTAHALHLMLDHIFNTADRP